MKPKHILQQNSEGFEAIKLKRYLEIIKKQNIRPLFNLLERNLLFNESPKEIFLERDNGEKKNHFIIKSKINIFPFFQFNVFLFLVPLRRPVCIF